jgi:hypothetical protein
MSATLLWIMCAAIVLALAGWLAAVLLADRNPAFRQSPAEVVPDEDPEEPTVRAYEERGASPMDL